MSACAREGCGHDKRAHGGVYGTTKRCIGNRNLCRCPEFTSQTDVGAVEANRANGDGLSIDPAPTADPVDLADSSEQWREPLARTVAEQAEEIARLRADLVLVSGNYSRTENRWRAMASTDPIKALHDCVRHAYEYGVQDGEFVAAYVMPTGPIHRAIQVLDTNGIVARPWPEGAMPDALRARINAERAARETAEADPVDLAGLVSRIASSAMRYDQRVYALSDDGIALQAYLTPGDLAVVGERPSDMTARLVAERDAERAARETAEAEVARLKSMDWVTIYDVQDEVFRLRGEVSALTSLAAGKQSAINHEKARAETAEGRITAALVIARHWQQRGWAVDSLVRALDVTP